MMPFMIGTEFIECSFDKDTFFQVGPGEGTHFWNGVKIVPKPKPKAQKVKRKSKTNLGGYQPREGGCKNPVPPHGTKGEDA